MLTTDERLIIGLKVLERLRPSLRKGRQELTSMEQQPLPPADGCEEAQPTVETPDIYLPTLQALLEEAGPLSPYSVVLGTCDDGLPFLIDLTNPAPGSLLIVGDRCSGKTRLTRSVLASAGLLNLPGQVSFCILASDPGQYEDLSAEANCTGLFAAGADTTALLDALVQTAEQRKRGHAGGPAILVAIDSLDDCLADLSAEQVVQLHWLIRHGPRSRIWTVATLSSDQVGLVDERFLAAFRTRIVGSMQSGELAAWLAGDGAACAQELVSGSQFCVPFGEDWICFWICEAEE